MNWRNTPIIIVRAHTHTHTIERSTHQIQQYLSQCANKILYFVVVAIFRRSISSIMGKWQDNIHDFWNDCSLLVCIFSHSFNVARSFLIYICIFAFSFRSPFTCLSALNFFSRFIFLLTRSLVFHFLFHLNFLCFFFSHSLSLFDSVFYSLCRYSKEWIDMEYQTKMDYYYYFFLCC